MDDGSTISADRMDISDGGHKISFQGEVKSAVVMGEADADPSANPDEAAK